MKKLLVLMLAIVTVFILAGCAEAAPDADDDNTSFEGSLEDILAKIYDTAKVTDSFRDYIKDGLMTVAITPENVSYHLGKDTIDFDSAIASEPMIQPGAYSLCLVRVKGGADIEQIKTDIKESVDPRKWVCVGVEPSNIIVDSIGDVIFLVMSDDQAKPLHNAFVALGK